MIKRYQQFNESFLSKYEDIDDILTPLSDISNPNEQLSYCQSMNDNWQVEKIPNTPEYCELNFIKYPIKGLTLNNTINILSEFRDIQKRLDISCEKQNIKYEYYINGDGLCLIFRKMKENIDVIDYEKELGKLIDINSYYYVLRGGEIVANKFIIRDKYENYISHGISGNYFNIDDFKNAFNRDKKAHFNRMIYKIGEERELYLKLTGEKSDNINVIKNYLRNNIKKTTEGYCSSRTTPEEFLKMFDQATKNIT